MNHLISLLDMSNAMFQRWLELAIQLKKETKNGISHPLLAGKTLAMIFTKASTRTRISFEVGMYQLGGASIFITQQDSQLGRGEPIRDTANVMSGYVDGLMIRTSSHKDVEDFARFGSIPVINGLTDLMHPCQVLADLLTIYEIKGTFKGLKFAYLGDGNNMAHSLLHGAAMTGMDITVATPTEFMCDAQMVQQARERALSTGCKITITHDPLEAIADADVVCTDTWISMGQEEEKEQRLKTFMPYQVNLEKFSTAKKNAIFMHCLPAYRGYEVTEDVIDSDASVIYQEAENRLHAQKAVLALLMGSLQE